MDRRFAVFKQCNETGRCAAAVVVCSRRHARGNRNPDAAFLVSGHKVRGGHRLSVGLVGDELGVAVWIEAYDGSPFVAEMRQKE